MKSQLTATLHLYHSFISSHMVVFVYSIFSVCQGFNKQHSWGSGNSAWPLSLAWSVQMMWFEDSSIFYTLILPAGSFRFRLFQLSFSERISSWINNCQSSFNSSAPKLISAQIFKIHYLFNIICACMLIKCRSRLYVEI